MRIKLNMPDLAPNAIVTFPDVLFVTRNFDYKEPPIAIATITKEGDEYFADIVGEMNAGGEINADKTEFSIKVLGFDASSKPQSPTK